MDIDLTQYVAGGYFIIKSTVRDADRSPDLLPERLISLSGCICPSAQVYWIWEGNLYDPESLGFGILPEKLPELDGWGVGDKSKEMTHPNVFCNLETAQSFASDFLEQQEDVVLLGVGLPEGHVVDFLTENQQIIMQMEDGTERPYISGVQQMLSQRLPLAAGGNLLGFEIVSCPMEGVGHSWLCSGLERDMVDQFGIRPNAHGLIATHTEAMQVYDWIAEDEQRGHRAEPEPYYPWLLVNYPLTTTEQ